MAAASCRQTPHWVIQTVSANSEKLSNVRFLASLFGVSRKPSLGYSLFLFN